jgi:ArsR family transcriptional regulator, arsenate/arsenite/antimonite-responsive transcriptional repressor
MTDHDLVRIAKALADRTRLGILRTITARGEVCCGDLWRTFPITAATVTHHLKVLDAARLVDMRRDGQFIRIRAQRDTLDAYRAALAGAFDASPSLATRPRRRSSPR